MALEPGGIIAWIVVGLIAGWLTGKVMRGGGYGVFRDIILGIVGAFIGGIVMSLFGVQGQAGFMGSTMIAFVGAVILVAVVRLSASESLPTARFEPPSSRWTAPPNSWARASDCGMCRLLR